MVRSVSRCCLSHTAHAAALPSEERKEYAEKVGVSSTLVLVLYAPSVCCRLSWRSGMLSVAMKGK